MTAAYTPKLAEAAAQAVETIIAVCAPSEHEGIDQAGPVWDLRADARDPKRGLFDGAGSGVAGVFKTTGRVLRSRPNVIRRSVAK